MKSKKRAESDVKGTVWTIGHSTRSAEEFLQLLKSHDIVRLIDVRSFPGSRRYPQFNRETLATALASAGIDYQHLPSLGGRRRPNPESKNVSLRNAGFRAYADHMESAEFQEGIAVLKELAQTGRTAVMCAESLWWRCHRSLISDYLKADDWEVLHILNEQRAEPHSFTSAAQIVDGRLSYAGLLA
jgi:uncharacterized protein (DUF488 family)